MIRQIYLQAMPNKPFPFLQFLPPQTPLDTLAGTADRVVSSLQQAFAAVNAGNSTEVPSDQDCHLAQTNSARSSAQVGTYIFKRHGNPRRRSSSRERNRRFCWFHDNFGPKASKAEPPCEYNKSLN